MPLTPSTPPAPPADRPRCLRLHPSDDVAVIVDDGGVPAGARFADGLCAAEAIPQSHKIALRAIAEGEPVRRYGEMIGTARHAIAAGAWVKEADLVMPAAPPLDSLPLATAVPPAAPPLAGYTFEGYRNADGSVGTRNLLGITTTVQCVTGVLEHAVRRIRDELLPRYPHVDDVVALTHAFGCGVGDRRDRGRRSRSAPCATSRRNPNFGGQALVVGLGCEMLQPAQVVDERDGGARPRRAVALSAAGLPARLRAR